MKDKLSPFVKRKANNAGVTNPVVNPLVFYGVPEDILSGKSEQVAAIVDNSKNGGKSQEDKNNLITGIFGSLGSVFSGAGDLVSSITGKSKQASNVYVDPGTGGGNATPWIIGGVALVIVVVIVIILLRKS